MEYEPGVEVARRRHQRVVAGAAVEHVGIAGGAQPVVAGAAEQLIEVARHAEPVVAGLAMQHVADARGGQEIVGDLVLQPSNHVAACGAIARGSGMVSLCFSALACATMRNALESFRSRQNDSCA